MNTNSTNPSIMVVESHQPLPPMPYGWLDGLGLEVLGPTDDLFDAYRLARDRRPRLAIVDKRIGEDCRKLLHATLESLKVPCFDLAASACRRQEALTALGKAMFSLSEFAARHELVRKRDLGTAVLLRPTGIASGTYGSSVVHLTA
jgi:hypothetical protein